MKLSDFAGDTSVCAEDAKTFLHAWFKPEDKICVVGRRSQKTGRLDVVSQSLIAYEFDNELSDEMLQSIIFDEDGSTWNLYIGVCPIKNDISLTKRGTEDNIAYAPGVWADIDVKPGGFESQMDILKWLHTLELYPSIVCGSGSGGVHAYWRTNWNETADKELVNRWWSYLDEMAGERSIDKLIDLTRILRLPGSTYFPKDLNEHSKLAPVSLIEVTGATYSVQDIRTISADAFERKNQKRAKLVYDDAQRRLDMDALARDLLSDSGNNRWTLYMAIAQIEDLVNNNLSWAEILEPHGWTFMRQLRDGSNEWARPGRSERSAVVDFEGSPVMSLLSSSEETGLSDLKDAGIHLSKYRVALRLKYNDVEEDLIRDIIDRQRGGEL